MNKSKKLLAIGSIAALGLAACGSDDEPAAETPSTDAPPAEAPADGGGDAVKTCLVTGLAGVDDQSFNASAWQGVQDAIAAGAATDDSFFLESGEASQYQANVDQMIDQGCEHIVTVGFDLGRGHGHER